MAQFTLNFVPDVNKTSYPYKTIAALVYNYLGANNYTTSSATREMRVRASTPIPPLITKILAYYEDNVFQGEKLNRVRLELGLTGTYRQGSLQQIVNCYLRNKVVRDRFKKRIVRESVTPKPSLEVVSASG